MPTIVVAGPLHPRSEAEMDWGTQLTMPFVFSPGDHQSHQAEEMNITFGNPLPCRH